MAKKVYKPSSKVTAAVDLDGEIWQAWDDVREAIGDSLFIDELFAYLPMDTIKDFVETAVRHYDLDYVDDEDFPGRDF